jgi:hypothetical protein
MDRIKIEKGILAGKELARWAQADLLRFATSDRTNTNLENVSCYQEKITRITFRSVNFRYCNFARAEFESVVFRKCTFFQVDFTRAVFKKCIFSDCKFVDSDPYYAQFPQTVIPAASFKRCYKFKDLNKALVLFSQLKQDLEAEGNHRASRAADYYYRRWERALLYHRWRAREISGMWSWLWSLFIGSLTGYGERPQYLLFWVTALITVSALIYRGAFPGCVSPADHKLLGYWYFSFKVFCGKGFTSEAVSQGLVVSQVTEFSLGLVFLAMLVASVTRKLS